MSESVKIEKKWQKRWEKDRVFEVDPDPKRKKFFLTVPYPYPNGALHIGHGRTYTVGDLIARYKRMQGFNVLYPMASHIPVIERWGSQHMTMKEGEYFPTASVASSVSTHLGYPML